MVFDKIKPFLLPFLFAFLTIAYASDDNIYPLLLDQMSAKLRTGNTSNPADKKQFSLEDCINLSVDKSGKLHIAKEEYRLALLNYKHSRRDLFPKLDLKYEKINGTTTGEDFRGQGQKLEMQYPIFASGRMMKLYKQAKINLEIAKLKHDQTLLEVFTETEKAYYVWSEAKARYNAASDLEKVSTEAFNVEKKRFEQKLSRDIDWLETKIYSEEVTQKVKEAKNDLKLAEFSLRQIIDLYAGDFDIQNLDNSTEIKMNAEELIPLALDKRPDIKMNRLLERVNKYNRDIAKAESRIQINLDGFTGRRAENFVSEALKYENEYYIGLSGSLPLGKNTLETQVIKQNTVPSAGQTTSTEFTSESVKFNILDNKFDSTRLEGLIKYYKALEDSEKVKKAAIFEIGKAYIETLKAFDHLGIAKQKLELAQKKLEFEKLSIAKNEANVNEYLREVIESYDSQTAYSKALSGYYTAVSDLNKALGSPGYFNPATGTTSTDYIEKYYSRSPVEKSFWKSFFRDSNTDDPYYPQRQYEDIKFRTVKENSKLMFWKTENEYEDPVEQTEKEKNPKSWWKFWGNK